MRRARHLRLFGVAAAAALLLTACGGGGISNDAGSGSGKTCGTFNIAVNPWTGYVADAYVVGDLAQKKLGCTVTYKNVKEEVGW